MTQDERDQREWANFWFLNGGSIHGIWKRRQWSALRVLAIRLPMEAWKASANAERARARGLVEAVEKHINSRCDSDDVHTFFDMQKALSAYLLPRRKREGVMNELKKPAGVVFAHGATKPICIIEDEWCPRIAFGSTVCGEDEYPVIIANLHDIKRLRDWLDKAIPYLEQKIKP